MTLKKQILYCLEQYPETTNDDIALTIKIWQHFPPYNEDTNKDVKIIHSEKTGKDYIALEDLHYLQREDNIKRERAIIQNDEGLFLPTNPRVREFRKPKGRGDQDWKKKHGYGTKEDHINKNKLNL